MEIIFVLAGTTVMGLLIWLVGSIERIAMDTAALKQNFGDFATSFSKFAGDFAAFLAKQPQDTPEQIADVKAVSDGLAGFKSQVDALDAAINPPAGNVP